MYGAKFPNDTYKTNQVIFDFSFYKLSENRQSQKSWLLCTDSVLKNQNLFNKSVSNEQAVFITEGVIRGSENRKTAQKYAKKLQTPSYFFLNTETAHPLCFQLQPQRPSLWLIRIESKQWEHKAVRLYKLTSGMEFHEVDALLTETVNHIKYVKGRNCKPQLNCKLI